MPGRKDLSFLYLGMSLNLSGRRSSSVFIFNHALFSKAYNLQEFKKFWGTVLALKKQSMKQWLKCKQSIKSVMGGSRNETQGVKEEAGEPMKDFTMKCLLEAFWKILHFLLMVIDLFSHLCGSCEMVVSMVLYYITLVHISCSLTPFFPSLSSSVFAYMSSNKVFLSQLCCRLCFLEDFRLRWCALWFKKICFCRHHIKCILLNLSFLKIKIILWTLINYYF